MRPFSEAQLLNPPTPRVSATPPQTALVVRSDDSGVWCARIGSDPNTPTGPCRGAAPGGMRLSVGTVVLLTITDHGPWVAAIDEEAAP